MEFLYETYNMKDELKRFLPVFYFVGKFIGFYVLGNIAYGWMIESFSPMADPITNLVSYQASGVLNLTGFDVVTKKSVDAQNVLLNWNGNNILAVYEGCNGLNVMIVFLSFMIAMGPVNKKFSWFVPLGLLMIHVMNLLRIYGLFMVAVYLPQQFYFVHKYLFTGVLYAVVFVWWVLWLRSTRLLRR